MSNTINYEERAKQNLEYFAKNYNIFIDTCSLLEPTIFEFLNNFITYLIDCDKKIIIPQKVGEELMKHYEDKDNESLSNKAKKMIKLLNTLKECNVIEYRGSDTDGFADNTFLVAFTQYRIKHKLLLITQDKGLAQDILGLNRSNSVMGKEIQVKRINKYGYLSNVIEGGQMNQANHNANKVVADKNNAFKLCDRPTTLEDQKIEVTHIPGAGDVVCAPTGQMQLLEEVASGGEGIVYNVSGNPDFVAKIYKKENNTTLKYEKIKRMVSKKIDCKGICYPSVPLYNQYGEFVGYLMPKAKGKELQRCIFITPLFKKEFPDWQKRDTVELCITILKKIKYLHSKNIILGDINPGNILVVSPKEVYFVDTDSYQIEEFPCPVGTITFTAPEIHLDADAKKKLLKKENEYFAIATLLFMIMLPGKTPYAQLGGASMKDNIINMDFSYPLGEKSNNKVPEGPWKYMWSHMTYNVKKAFYNTFYKGGDYASPDKRLNEDQWLEEFNKYLYFLDSGKYKENDEMSGVIFPTRRKESGNSKTIVRTCTACGSTFEMSESEYLFYQSKGLSIPKRCEACRATNNKASYSYTPRTQYNTSYNRTQRTTQNSSQNTGLFGSFIKWFFGI